VNLRSSPTTGQLRAIASSFLPTGILRTLYRVWVRDWVQLKQGKWLPISFKRHQTRHLDFWSSRLLTEGLLVRI
jgi:hypothetical protein